jgi:hypothetical protein
VRVRAVSFVEIEVFMFVSFPSCFGLRSSVCPEGVSVTW